jgi:hypothetical protein
MSNPFTATWRIMFPYTIDGLTHKLHEFTKPATAGGLTYTIPTRAGGAINWEAAADDYAAAISNMLAAATTPGTAELQQKSGVAWVTLASHTLTFPNSAGSYQKATQLTATYRDTAFNLEKSILLECNDVAPRKNKGYASIGGGTALQLMVKEFTENNTLTNAPYKWLVSGQELYLRVGPLIAVTISLNHKVRRARNLA